MLAANLPSSNYNVNSQSNHSTSLQNTFVFENITASEIERTIAGLDKRKSTGIDGINGVFVSTFSRLLAPVLSQLFNKSIIRGEFPKDMKVAKIIPIAKTKSNLDIVSNYRPIALLSIFSKIFEKIIASRLTNFFTKYNILYEHQYGFRAHYSTKLALLESIDEIRKNLESGNLVAGIYLDLSKAFDSLDHGILLSKIYNYGIRGFVFDWVKSYISNRILITYTNGVASSPKLTNYGVPQGSVLGPLLFLIYINDMGSIPNLVANPKLFADDANIFVPGANFNALHSNCITTISSLHEWIISNRLTLNIDKTCYMIFLPSSKQVIPSNFILTINNRVISRVTFTKFLGVLIDDKLVWKNHIDELSLHLRKFIGIFFTKLVSFYPYLF